MDKVAIGRRVLTNRIIALESLDKELMGTSLRDACEVPKEYFDEIQDIERSRTRPPGVSKLGLCCALERART
jgi:hypothetical protein